VQRSAALGNVTDWMYALQWKLNRKFSLQGPDTLWLVSRFYHASFSEKHSPSSQTNKPTLPPKRTVIAASYSLVQPSNIYKKPPNCNRSALLSLLSSSSNTTAAPIQSPAKSPGLSSTACHSPLEPTYLRRCLSQAEKTSTSACRSYLPSFSPSPS